MKQNNILNTIAAIVMALVIAVMTVQAAGAVIVGSVGFPTDIAIDNAGNIYVTDTDFNNIDIINIDGTQNLVGVGQIEFPSAVAVSAGKIYVADDGNNSIKVFSSTTGVLLETIGVGQLNSPNGVAVDSAGNVHVADSGNNRIQTFNINGSNQTVGSGLNFPSGIFEDGAGNIYVADTGNNRIQIFKKDGSVQTVGGGQLNSPNDVDVDSSGNIYVTDTGNDNIKVFNPGGTLLRTIGSRGAAEGQFDLPMGAAVNSTGHIFVADSNNNRVQVIAPTAPPTGAAIANITAFSVGNGIRAGSILANVTVMNLDIVPHIYAVVVSGVNQRGFPLAGTGVVSLNPGQSIRIPVLVTIPPSADLGSYSLLAGVFPFDNQILDPASLIGNLAGPGVATVS